MESKHTTGAWSERLHIGTQGWNYDFWAGLFYPDGTRAHNRLEQYSRVFDCVEIDSTFYAMPLAERFRSWYERTPADFTFTVKLPRDITHDARLIGADGILAEFCERASLLQEKLGPLLIQMPPDFSTREREAAEKFVRALPTDFRFAIEFRHATWFASGDYEFLRDTPTTLAVSVGPWLSSRAAMEVARAAPGGFRYLRWMGSPRHQELSIELIRERDDDMAEWAETILEFPEIELYAFFNNDYQGHSPESARRLQALLGLTPRDPAILRPQGELF